MILEEALILRKHFKSQVIYEEAIELFNAVLNTPIGDVVEVGSASGGTTIVLIAAAEQKGKIVYSIDPYPNEYEQVADGYYPGIMNEFKTEFKKNILDGPWKNILQFNEATESCINKIPDDLSVVFIDSCHELSMVENEIKLLYPKLGEHGRLYVHDIFCKKGQLSGKENQGLTKTMDFLFKNEEMFMFSAIKKISFTGGREILCIEKWRKTLENSSNNNNL